MPGTSSIVTCFRLCGRTAWLPCGAAIAVWLVAAYLLPVAPALAEARDAPAAIDLRPAWEPGQSARYAVWSRRVRQTTMSAHGQSQQVSMTIVTEGEFTWTTERLEPDGSITARMTLDWMSLTFENPEGERQVIDSRRGSGDIPPMHQALQAMSGAPIRVTVAADGSIQSVAGTDAIRRQIQARPFAPEDRDFIRSATELAVLVAAPPTAQPGGNWRTQHAWSHEAGTMHHRVTYTIEGVSEIAGIPVATVLGESKLELEVDRTQMPADAPPIDIRQTLGTRQSQVMFDLQRREAVGRNSLERTRIEVTIRLPEATLNQRTDETIQSQALRIAEH